MLSVPRAPRARGQLTANSSSSSSGGGGGSRVIGDYRLMGALGSGKFATVELAVHRPSMQKVAVKVTKRMTVDCLLEHEARVLQHMRHPNIVNLFQVIETVENIYLVMEYAPHGTLDSYLRAEGGLSEEEAQPLCAQLCGAVAYMHAAGVVHRDIKAENILMGAGNEIKVENGRIADFGFSAFTSDATSLAVNCGSPPYAAPELFGDGPCDSMKADVWALGIVMVYMLSGKLPFHADSLTQLRQHISKGEWPRPPNISDTCQTVLEGALAMNAKERLNARELEECEWLRLSSCANGCVEEGPAGADLAMQAKSAEEQQQQQIEHKKEAMAWVERMEASTTVVDREAALCIAMHHLHNRTEEPPAPSCRPATLIDSPASPVVESTRFTPTARSPTSPSAQKKGPQTSAVCSIL